MASAKQLRAEIVLGGNLDGSFGKTMGEVERKLGGLGKDATKLGLTLAGLATPFLKFGKDSVALFVDFDDTMRKVQAATGATTEEMEALEEAARAMGASTRFTASDAAEALYYLGLSGMGAGKSMELLPGIMNMAAASGMGIADASTIVVDAMFAMGLGVDDVDVLIDQMAQTTRSASTDMAGLGEGILSIGGNARLLSGGTAELNMALGQMANFGIKGAEGGIKLRNILLSLAAPTKKASDLMSELGLSEEELAEVLDGFDAGAASEVMQKLAFSAFDSEGAMKPLVQVFAELDAVLAGMSDQERAGALSAIFNKRDLVGVEALLAGSGGGMQGLSDKIEHSQGVAREFRDTMDGGIGGALATLRSAYEELQISFAQPLAQGVTDFAAWLTGVANAASETDPERIQALAGFVLTVAGTGASLIAIGGAAKGISMGIGAITALAATPAGGFLLAAAGIAGLAVAIKSVADNAEREAIANLADKFGDISLDTAAIEKLVSAATGAYAGGLTALEAGATRLKELVGTYQAENANMSEVLIQAFLGGELSDEQEGKLLTQAGLLVDTGRGAIKQAWNNAEEKNKLFWGLENEAGAMLLGQTNAVYEELEGRAKDIGDNFKDTLVRAMASGASQKELSAIARQYQEDMRAVMETVAKLELYDEGAKIVAGADFNNLSMESFGEIMGQLEGWRGKYAEMAEELRLSQRTSAISGGWLAGKSWEDIEKDLAGIDARAGELYSELAQPVDEMMGRTLGMGMSGVLGSVARNYGGNADENPISINDAVAMAMHRVYGAGWQTDPRSMEYMGKGGMQEAMSYMDETWDAQSAIARLQSMIEPYMQGLYEQAAASGEAVPQEIADAITQYESLKKLSDSSDAMYGFLLDAVRNNGTLDQIYELLFGQGVGAAQALAEGMGSVYGPPSPPDLATGNPGGFATGGTVTMPTLSWIGEAGPETVVPHKHDANSLGLLRAAAAGAGFGGGMNITVNSSPVFHGGEPVEIMQALEGHRRELVDMIGREMGRRNATTF